MHFYSINYWDKMKTIIGADINFKELNTTLPTRNTTQVARDFILERILGGDIYRSVYTINSYSLEVLRKWQKAFNSKGYLVKHDGGGFSWALREPEYDNDGSWIFFQELPEDIDISIDEYFDFPCNYCIDFSKPIPEVITTPWRTIDGIVKEIEE